MMSVLLSLLLTVRGLARSRAGLHLDVLALRHQLRGVDGATAPRSVPVERGAAVWRSVRSAEKLRLMAVG